MMSNRTLYTLAIVFAALGSACVGVAAGFRLGVASVVPPPPEVRELTKQELTDVCYKWWFKTPPQDKVYK